MTAAFAISLLVTLALAACVAFASPRTRPRLKWLLAVALLASWTTLALSISRIVARTSSTVVTRGAARSPQLVASAAREALVLFAALGGPAILATLLALLALRASRPDQRRATPPRTP